MTEPAPLAPVVLSLTVQVNGQTVMAQQHVSQALWESAQHDQLQRDVIMGYLHRTLGEVVARKLRPTLTVHLPTELEEAVMQTAVAELGQQVDD